MKLRHHSPLSRILMSAAALGAVGSLGVLTTNATFTDQVTMAQVTVQGGTLDLQANAGNGPNQAWSVSMATTNMVPGQEQSGTVAIKNNGTVPFTVTVTTTGTDASACFSYYFRETSATGATKSATFPVNLTGMGTAAGADATTAAMSTGITNLALNDVPADPIWETDDVKTYTLTARMKTSCATNGASGSMDFTINATQ
jgi:hypothetical protein